MWYAELCKWICTVSWMGLFLSLTSCRAELEEEIALKNCPWLHIDKGLHMI